MGFGSGRSLCRGEGFLGLPPPLGGGGSNPIPLSLLPSSQTPLVEGNHQVHFITMMLQSRFCGAEPFHHVLYI